MKSAYVTLVANADYALGALALLRSLRTTGSEVPLLVLAPAECDGLGRLAAEGAQILPTELPQLSDGFRARHSRARQHAAAPFTRGEKPAFHDPLMNFVKLKVWELEGFDTVVFVDADAIFLKNCDRLFAYPEFSAAPNVYDGLDGFHRLNSGVFVARPDRGTYQAMLARLDAPGAFWARTDQTFLESFFPDWHGLPYTYNVLQYVFFRLPDLWRWPAIRILHYQYEKPWQREHPKRHLLQPLIDLWWDVLEGRSPPARLDAPRGLPDVG